MLPTSPTSSSFYKTFNSFTIHTLILVITIAIHLNTVHVAILPFAVAFQPYPPYHHHHHRQTSTTTTRGATITTPTSLHSSSSTQFTVRKVDPLTYGIKSPANDNYGKRDEVMDLASFRNNRTSYRTMISNQLAKREAVDVGSSLKKAIGTGSGLGLAVFAASYFGVVSDNDGGNLVEALTNGGVIGVLLGALLSYNVLSGKSVYVMGEAEAINRLTVDYVAGVKIGQDVAFVASIPPRDDENNAPTISDNEKRYDDCGSIVGCVDCQLRNSKQSTAVKPNDNAFTVREVPGLPAHVHLKNMEVDENMRRRGTGRTLVIDGVEAWAREETDAECLTLEVEPSNIAAVSLYESCGFQFWEGEGSNIGGAGGGKGGADASAVAATALGLMKERNFMRKDIN